MFSKKPSYVVTNTYTGHMHTKRSLRSAVNLIAHHIEEDMVSLYAAENNNTVLKSVKINKDELFKLFLAESTSSFISDTLFYSFKFKQTGIRYSIAVFHD